MKCTVPQPCRLDELWIAFDQSGSSASRAASAFVYAAWGGQRHELARRVLGVARERVLPLAQAGADHLVRELVDRVVEAIVHIADGIDGLLDLRPRFVNRLRRRRSSREDGEHPDRFRRSSREDGEDLDWFRRSS
jgi:hypothetical protein